jgi:hypothetical protein
MLRQQRLGIQLPYPCSLQEDKKDDKPKEQSKKEEKKQEAKEQKKQEQQPQPEAQQQTAPQVGMHANGASCFRLNPKAYELPSPS